MDQSVMSALAFKASHLYDPSRLQRVPVAVARSAETLLERRAKEQRQQEKQKLSQKARARRAYSVFATYDTSAKPGAAKRAVFARERKALKQEYYAERETKRERRRQAKKAADLAYSKRRQEEDKEKRRNERRARSVANKRG